MKFGKLRSKARRYKQNLLKVYFVGGILVLMLFFVFYTNHVMRNIRKDIQVVPDLYAKFIGLPDNANLEDFLLQYFMANIIPKIKYPIILADSLKVPFSWENMELEKKSYNELDEKEIKFLYDSIKKMESKDNIIPLRYDEQSDKAFGYVFYGESKIMKHLRIMPYIEGIIVILFTLMGIYGILSLKKNEENTLWVGLAKETAHQFGTPISSLMGWLDIVSMKIEQHGSDPEMIAMLNYMKTDIDRLQKIASRFGKVGSLIKKVDTNLSNVIQDTVDYFQSRLPSLGQQVSLEYISEKELEPIKIDSDLIKWTLENLIKNSIDALKNTGGKISVQAFQEDSKTFILVKDNGVGLPKSMYKKIFYPGVTSKKRGWGLGLSLAKRIIEEFHNGRIRVLESEINKGTTFEILLREA